MRFIIIDSKIDITVTNGLSSADKTNYGSKVGNNLNVQPLWTRTAVHIKAGKHVYPSEIADWQTVKTLEENNVFTLGREIDDGTPEELQMLEEFRAELKQVEDEMQPVETEAEPKRRRKKSDDTAE